MACILLYFDVPQYDDSAYQGHGAGRSQHVSWRWFGVLKNKINKIRFDQEVFKKDLIKRSLKKTWKDYVKAFFHDDWASQDSRGRREGSKLYKSHHLLRLRIRSAIWRCHWSKLLEIQPIQNLKLLRRYPRCVYFQFYQIFIHVVLSAVGGNCSSYLSPLRLKTPRGHLCSTGALFGHLWKLEIATNHAVSQSVK